MTGATTQDVTIACDLIADRDVWRAMARAAIEQLRAEQLRHSVTQRRYLRLLEEHRKTRKPATAGTVQASRYYHGTGHVESTTHAPSA